MDGRSDLSTYSLVILPATYLLTDAAARRFEDYVSDGGRLVVGYLSGIVDESNTIRLGGYPGALRKVLGAWSEEMHPLAGEGEEVKLETADGGTASASYWTEHVHTETAEVLATYESGRLAGSPAVTRNSFGKGTAVYLSARVDDTFLEALLATEREASGVHPELAAPPGVQVRRRSGKDSSFLLVLNHNDAPVNVDVGRGGTDRLSGRPVEGSVELAANGVLVLQESGATADAADETSR
ncbi:Beta-galactosidase BgaP [compost metagenome]